MNLSGNIEFVIFWTRVLPNSYSLILLLTCMWYMFIFCCWNCCFRVHFVFDSVRCRLFGWLFSNNSVLIHYLLSILHYWCVKLHLFSVLDKNCIFSPHYLLSILHYWSVNLHLFKCNIDLVSVFVLVHHLFCVFLDILCVFCHCCLFHELFWTWKDWVKIKLLIIGCVCVCGHAGIMWRDYLTVFDGLYGWNLTLLVKLSND